MRNFAGPYEGENSILHKLFEFKSPQLFDLMIPGMLVQFKWEQFARKIYLKQFYLYLSLVMTFSIESLIGPMVNSAAQSHDTCMEDAMCVLASLLSIMCRPGRVHPKPLGFPSENLISSIFLNVL